MLSSSRMKRRRFLRTIGGAAIAGVAGLLVGGDTAAEEGAAETPRLCFVQLNDAHINANTNHIYETVGHSAAKLAHLVAAFNAGTYFTTPDFVMGVGDMADDTGADSYNKVKELLAPLKCPYYPVIGNHDGEGYSSAFGSNRVNYTFHLGGIEFVVFNNISGGVDAARNQWLKNVLDASPGAPKVLCCHVPLLPIREKAVLTKSFGFGDYYNTVDPTLLGLVDDPTNNVVAVLSGHVHLTGVVKRKGVYHICISGTASYPCDFAYYEVFRDRIHVQVMTLPENLQTPGTDIHGKPRWEIDYTDDAHATHDLYMGGNAAERDFTIPLKQSEGL